MGALRSKPYGPGAGPNPAALAGAALTIVIAAVAGWLLAGVLASSPPAAAPASPPATIRSGNTKLVLRAGWREVARIPKLPGVDGPGVRAFAPPDGGAGRMVVNVLAAGGTSLPKATRTALRVPSGRAERAKVAGLDGIGYTSLAIRKVPGLADVYLVPTAAGVLTIGCVSPIDDPLPIGSCPWDVLSVTAHQAPAPDPRAALKRRLPGAMSALNAARRHDRAVLRAAGTSRRQVAPARALARAYGSAAARLRPVAPASGGGAALPDALSETADAYRGLATAAARHDTSGWATAGVRVTAAERVVAAQVEAARH